MPEHTIGLFALNQKIREEISEVFPDFHWVTAEIMELNVNRSGHCYLELIEKSGSDNSIIARSRATIWSRRFNMLKAFFETTTGTALRPGIKVLVKAEVSFHEIYGLSLNISDIDPSYTMGDLAMKRKEIIGKLQSAGVFEMNRDLLFPVVPQRIAVISSETAAGYGDFTDTLLRNRFGFRVQLTLFPAIMQGEAAERTIIEALEQINEQVEGFDVVVLIRGGGSKADLQCFDSYELCLHLAQFPLPVVTGIGHERDETIADLVANRALKTPTAVAEFIIGRLLEFSSLLLELEEKLFRLSRSGLALANEQLALLTEKTRYLWKSLLSAEKQRLERHNETLTRVVTARTRSENERLLHLGKQMELLRPGRVLSRGYSITSVNGKVLKSAADAVEGDVITTKLADGSLESRVLEPANTPQKK